MAAEDVAYWLVGGLLVFRMIYSKNDGTIRGYSVMALLLGMILYYIVVGERLVHLISGIWERILRQTKKVASRVTKPIRKLCNKFKKIMKNIKNVLKSMKKTVTIAFKKH
jgi:phage-related protein